MNAPTYTAEFDLGQPVVLYLEGTTYRGTITQRRFDPDAGDWFYRVSGLPTCEIPAYEIHPR
jgi:hypothetical protein